MSRNSLYVTLPNMSEAIRLEKLCHQSGLGGQLVPTPRHFSAACTISWRGEPEQRDSVVALIKKYGVHIREMRSL